LMIERGGAKGGCIIYPGRQNSRRKGGAYFESQGMAFLWKGSGFPSSAFYKFLNPTVAGVLGWYLEDTDLHRDRSTIRWIWYGHKDCKRYRLNRPLLYC
jgi:hypothetical protein